ncbi:MAG: right-handed parallel beta-helix repeat-containing protein [Hyphomicrobiales bacterium]|nr:right-handed parallel beta-helix repeat-containing protein [Hyphomicrobiales bacterium]
MTRRRLALAVLILLVTWSAPLRAQNAPCRALYVRPEAGSLEDALAQARSLRKTEPDMHICIRLHEGTYFLPHLVRVGREETGGKGAETVLQRDGSGKVVLSGGIDLPVHAPRAATWVFDTVGLCGGVAQRSLYVNGNRRIRARFPKTGTFSIAGEIPRRIEDGKAFDAFRFAPDLDTGLSALNADSEIVAWHFWSMSRMGIRAVDRTTNVITLNGITSHTDEWGRFAKSGKFYFENVNGDNLMPGEWFQVGATITYRPTIVEGQGVPSVVLPCTPRLLEFGEGAHDVRVEGLSFVHTGESHRGYEQTPAQAGIGQHTSAAINLRGAQRIRFANVEVSGTADFAFLFDRRTRDAGLLGSKLQDIGGGAVAIGDPAGAYSRTALSEDIRSRNEIARNVIREGGRIRQDAVAIWIGDVGGNTLVGNQISGFSYSAISLGWGWGGMKLSRGNLIKGNVLSDIGQGELSDLAAIYTMSDLAGTIIRNNRISDVGAARYGGFGIYLDRNSSGLLVEGNSIKQTKSAGLALHYAADNVIRNNSICSVSPIDIVKPGALPNTIEGNDCRD